MPGPRVSVVMIFLNAERFMRDAIESVLAQSYRDWELLLVDDGSSDASGGIALEYARAHPRRVRYLEHEGHQNLGMSASRNLAIRSAGGEYVAFLDADDVWLPRKLQRHVAALESQPHAGMVYGATQYWFSWTGDLADAQRDYVSRLGVDEDTLVKPPDLLVAYLEDGGTVPCICSVLVRRGVLQDIGGFEEAFRGQFEDQVFYAKVCLRTPVFVTGGYLERYRQHPRSNCAVATRTGAEAAARRVYLQWLRRYIRRSGTSNTRLRTAVRQALGTDRRTLAVATRAAAVHVLAAGARLTARLRAWGRSESPRLPVGGVRFGNLRRLTPVSTAWGFDRGRPVDRYYIEGFLARHAEEIRGHVLEIGDNAYTKRFGADRVTISDVLNVTDDNPRSTIVADLTRADHIPTATFDCIVFTQTLQLIYDVRAAIATLHRVLKPGGVLLATVPGISQLDSKEWQDSWYWAFTTRSAERLFEEAFGRGHVNVETHGNVLAAIAFLQGLATEELRREELDHLDPHYQLLIAVRAQKPGGVGEGGPSGTASDGPRTI